MDHSRSLITSLDERRRARDASRLLVQNLLAAEEARRTEMPPLLVAAREAIDRAVDGDEEAVWEAHDLVNRAVLVYLRGRGAWPA